MKSLSFERNIGRFAAARIASSLGAGQGAKYGPLRLIDADAPVLPSPSWAHVQPVLAGICGSDLATVDGRSSRYFEDLVSFPFVPGHEVVGVLTSLPELGEVAPTKGAKAKPPTFALGDRVVIEPVLGCVARNIAPPCARCAIGDVGGCERITFGHIHAGLQTGYCTDTGGGWSQSGLVAHYSQLHLVPQTLSDKDAVMIEPLACGIHAALAATTDADQSIAIVGAGTVGLMVTASLSWLAKKGYIPSPKEILVGARYPHQKRLALSLGATRALGGEQLPRAVRRSTHSLSVGAPKQKAGMLAGGTDVVIDCVGSASSIAESLSMVSPRGRVLLVGMPAKVSVDLASLWHREVALVGAYAYGREEVGPDKKVRRTFDLAIEAAKDLHLGSLVSATYPIDRFEEALIHAGSAGTDAENEPTEEIAEW